MYDSAARITRTLRISLIAAASENNVIGRGNALPWHLPDDLKFFRDKTKGHAIIMGRKNYQSIIDAIGKPLPKRRNIIVTRDREFSAPGCEVASSVEEAIMYGHQEQKSAVDSLSQKLSTEEIFIIGGGQIYDLAMRHANYIYLTRVHAWIAGDVFFPEIDEGVWEQTECKEHPADEEHKFAFTFFTYKRKSRLHFEV